VPPNGWREIKCGSQFEVGRECPCFSIPIISLLFGLVYYIICKRYVNHVQLLKVMGSLGGEDRPVRWFDDIQVLVLWLLVTCNVVDASPTSLPYKINTRLHIRVINFSFNNEVNYICIQSNFGPGSSVGIATGYGLDVPGIKSRWGRDFPHLSRPTLGSTQPPVQWVKGLFPGGKERPGFDADPSPTSSAIVHERVELYLYSPYGPYGLYRASVPVQGWNLLLLSQTRECIFWLSGYQFQALRPLSGQWYKKHIKGRLHVLQKNIKLCGILFTLMSIYRVSQNYVST